MKVDLERLLATNEKGVVILPHGKVYRIVTYAGSIRELVNQGHMLPPPDGGYYVVEDLYDTEVRLAGPVQGG